MFVSVHIIYQQKSLTSEMVLICTITSEKFSYLLQYMCSKDAINHTTYNGMETDRHHYFKSGNIPKTDGGQIHLSFVTVL